MIRYFSCGLETVLLCIKCPANLTSRGSGDLLVNFAFGAQLRTVRSLAQSSYSTCDKCKPDDFGCYNGLVQLLFDYSFLILQLRMIGSYTIVCLLLGLSLALTVKLSSVGKRPKYAPPGPPTIPILGNLHLVCSLTGLRSRQLYWFMKMPAKNAHLQFQKWAEQYGWALTCFALSNQSNNWWSPIFSLQLGTKTTIVLSSDAAVKDLLDKRSANYSDRPDMFMGQTIASGNMRLVLMVSNSTKLNRRVLRWLRPRWTQWSFISSFSEIANAYADIAVVQKYGETWRNIRRIIHNILNIKAAVTYAPYQDLENKIMLKGFLDEPEKFLDHVRRYTFSLSTQLVFGYRCPDMNDPDLKELFVVRHSNLQNILRFADTPRILPIGENW